MSVVVIPTEFTPTHQTAGLEGYPAVDLFATPGSTCRISEDGQVTRISGHDPGLPPPLGVGGPWGLSVYFCGKTTGNVYYMTHFAKVARLGHYSKGSILGIIGDYPGLAGDHVHLGLHQGDSPEAHYPSIAVPAGCYLPSGTPQPPPPKPPKGVLPGPVPKPAWFWASLKQFLANRKKGT